MRFNKDSLYKISISTNKFMSALLKKINAQYCQITYISMQIYIFQNKYLSVNEFSQNIYFTAYISYSKFSWNKLVTQTKLFVSAHISYQSNYQHCAYLNSVSLIYLFLEIKFGFQIIFLNNIKKYLNQQ